MKTKPHKQVLSGGDDTERAWMVEFNRIGTEESVKGFPADPEMLIGSCCQEYFEAGLTPREAIDDLKHWNAKRGAQ